MKASPLRPELKDSIRRVVVPILVKETLIKYPISIAD